MTSRRSSREFVDVLEAHRRTLARVAEKRGVSRLKKLYDASEDDLARRLGRLPIGMKNSFTAHSMRTVLGQVRQGQAVVAARMAGELGDISREAQVESLRGLARDVNRLEMHFTGAATVLPVEEASRFAGVIDKRRTSLLRMHRASMSNYGSRLVGKMEEQMGLSLLQGETNIQAIDRVQEVAGNEWWQAERIARTETSWAFNVTHSDGISDVKEAVPGIMQQWVEFCDEDGNPLDDRVGIDSIAMHAQVAPPGGTFTMPAATRDGKAVPVSLIGMSWTHPPNRPNDRSVLSPWHKSWGARGWVLRSGQRIDL